MRILLIDDSPTSRAIAARLIGDRHEITSAASGIEGLALAASEGFDLMLIDLLMPGMDGQAVLAELRARGSRVPVIVMTADIQDSTRARLKKLGVETMIHKPLTREKILAGIAEATAAPGKGPDA